MRLVAVLLLGIAVGACGGSEDPTPCPPGATRCNISGGSGLVEKCSDPYATGTVGWHAWDSCSLPLGPGPCIQCSPTVAICSSHCN